MADIVRVTYGGVSLDALLVASVGSTGTSSQQMQGNVANAATDSGNPVKIGGYANSAAPTSVANGQRANAWFGLSGQLMVGLGTDNPVSEGFNSAIYGVSPSGTIRPLATLAYVWNGTTIIAQRGDTAGTYSISSPGSASANAITPAVGVGVSSLVVKASAGNLYGASMVAGATAGFLIAYNAASAPASGAALTAANILGCAAVAANAGASIGEFSVPNRFSAGIVLLFSTSTTTYTIPANLAAHITGRGV